MNPLNMQNYQTQLNAVQNQLQAIALSSANNNYETAKLIADQNILTLQQNNTNLINAIQGFNAVNQNMAAGFASVNQGIADLGYHLDNCCCSIKTQLLQDKYDALQTKYLEAQTNLSNAAQSQYILGALGRFVAYPPAADATTPA